MLAPRSLLLLLGITTAACGPLKLDAAPEAGAPRTRDAAVDPLDDETRADARISSAPTVKITAPTMGSALTSETLRIEGTSGDERGIASVYVRVGPNQPVLAKSEDNFRSWWVDAKAAVGTFVVEAVARDVDAQLSEPDRVMLLRASTQPDDAAPLLTITEPADKSSPLHQLVLVRGTATDDRAVTAITVSRKVGSNEEQLSERQVETSDFYGNWSRLVPLIPGENNLLTFVASDASGHETRATLTLLGRAEPDREPPRLTVLSPSDGAHVNTTKLTVTGSASDNKDVSVVKARVGRKQSAAGSVEYGEYVVAANSNAYSAWTLDIDVPLGAFELEVRAIDQGGLATSVKLNLTNDFAPVYSEEVAIPLRLRDGDSKAPLNFTLDKAGVNEVFTEQIQRDIRLLELDTTTLTTSAVEQIKASCGADWRNNKADPAYDCASTDYGTKQTPPVPWQRSPEFSMVRLLTMTPANVKVDGTSLQELKGLANDLNGLGLISTFNQILSDTLGIPLTQEIVSTRNVVRGLQDFWMSTHPEVLPGAKLPISLYDGMNDLTPLAERFGPRGAHPGLLDPSFPPRSQILTDAFEMRLTATSNLQWLDGVDASGKSSAPLKEYLALVIDTTAPTYDDVLEFDFVDPQKFDVVGLVNAPRVDMRMLLRESPTFIRSCVLENNTCKNSLPSAPAAGYVWSFPKYLIEPVVALAAYYEYQSRSNYTRDYTFLFKLATVTVGLSNPAGWATFATFFDLGNPPPDQFLWETILEVAQVALHNVTLPGQSPTVFAEGAVNVAFTLRNVDVGLTADGIRAAMRPKLQEQRHELSDMLLGDYQKNNGAVDFYYRRGADGAPYVFFVAPSDPLPSGYAYSKPGFFSDEALTQKVSRTEIAGSGDTVHEKLSLSPGQSTLYMADDTGATYRLRFVVDTPAEIRVFVAKKVR